MNISTKYFLLMMLFGGIMYTKIASGMEWTRNDNKLRYKNATGTEFLVPAFNSNQHANPTIYPTQLPTPQALQNEFERAWQIIHDARREQAISTQFRHVNKEEEKRGQKRKAEDIEDIYVAQPVFVKDVLKKQKISPSHQNERE